MVRVAVAHTPPLGAAVAGEAMKSWPAPARRIETEDAAATRTRRRRAGVQATVRPAGRYVERRSRTPVRCHVARAAGRQSARATTVSRRRWNCRAPAWVPAWACA